MEQFVAATTHRAPWNKGKLVGQKAPFKLKEIWVIRVRLQLYERIRDLSLFNLAIVCHRHQTAISWGARLPPRVPSSRRTRGRTRRAAGHAAR